MTEILNLLCDHAAGDAVSGVAGGVGLHIVGFGVDHDGGAAVAEQRVGAFAEGDVIILQHCLSVSFSVDGEVLHVTGVVAFGIIESVLLAFWIEMRSGRFEVGSVALGVLVEVDGVLAGRQIVKHQLEADARGVRHNDDRSDVFALSVLKVDFGFGCAGKSAKHQSDERSS
jgi:hypothetical protein